MLVVVEGTAGIVFPVAPKNRYVRSPVIWKCQIKFGSLHIEHWNSIIPYTNIADVSLQIEGGEVQLDHPTCWRGYDDFANPGIIPVVAWEVGRLDNTSRWRQIGAHSSASFAPANGFVGQIRGSIKREKIMIHSVISTSSLLGQSIQVHYLLDQKRSNWKESAKELLLLPWWLLLLL